MTDANPTTGFRALVSATHGPVTCSTCGCRLQPVGPEGAQAFFHFSGSNGRDARGCRIDCAELVHDDAGRAQVVVAAA